VRIAVYAIAKNEAAFAARFAVSAKAADRILVLDTGSTDGTQAILQEHGCDVREAVIDPWRFDRAFQAALDALPAGIDVAVFATLDDVFLPGWRAEIEKCWQPGVAMLRFFYVSHWEDVAQTIPSGGIWTTRVHDPRCYYWEYPICESLMRIDGAAINEIATDARLVEHHPDLTRDRRWYVDVFDRWMPDYADDPHMIQSYGRELACAGRHADAVVQYKRYLQLTHAYHDDDMAGGYPQMRSSICRLIADCLIHAQADRNEIVAWYLRSVGECPFQREPWMHLSRAWLAVGDAESALACASRGLAIDNRQASIEMEGWCWDGRARGLLERAQLAARGV
jgi:glycosyltransferase involved in cell wall biosynthesis